jgi:starvation-inducible DNA-binding protein
MNEDLISALKVVLANHYALYFKAQGHHWNVEGKNFPQYHEFYGMIYEDAYGAVDMVAEDIRKLGAYAPFKMSRFVELTTIPETEVSSDCSAMSMDILMAVNATIDSVNRAFAVATASDEQGIADDMAARDGCLKKIAWQLRSSLKD